MIQTTQQNRVLAPLPDYSGSALFLAACALLSLVAYVTIADWIGSNLALNAVLIVISGALISYCARTTWALYRASDLLDMLDGTVELGQTRRNELLQLSADAHRVRNILDFKSLGSIIQSIQARGDFELSPQMAMQLRSRAEHASQRAERGTDAGMLLLPLLAMSMGAWSFVTDGAAGTELNAAIMSPLMVGFLSAGILVLVNKQSQHASRLFTGHFRQWLALRSEHSTVQEQEIAALRDTIEQLERKVRHSYRLTKQQGQTLQQVLTQQSSGSDNQSENVQASVQLIGQKIIQQATDTRRVMQATRKDDTQGTQSFPMDASNDEREQGSDSSAAA